MESEKPTKQGWWWVRSADDRAVDGWKPVWAYAVTGDRLGFWDACRGGWVPVGDYAWGGQVSRG